jgi:autotransporter passenger strand-loop-strand repeat protein
VQLVVSNEVFWDASGTNVVDGVTIQSGAIASLDVSSGASIFDFVAGHAADDLVSSGGAATGTVLLGGIQDIDSGGSATDTSVGSGGSEFVLFGGTASGSLIGSGGAEQVFGVASNTVVSSGGAEFVFSGASASGSVVSAGGLIELGVASALSWNAAGQNVVDGVTIEAGAITRLLVEAGGSVTGFVVSSDGEEIIASGGSATGTVLDSGGAIDFQGLQGKSASWSNNVLALTLAGGGVVDLSLPGNFRHAKFAVLGDGLGGTEVSLKPANPVLAAPKSVVGGVTQTTSVPPISLSETGTVPGEMFTVTLTDARGALSATGNPAIGPVVFGPGPTSMTIVGTLSQVNTALATVTDTEPATAADTITVHASDSAGDSAARKVIAVKVNGPPTISAPTTVGVASSTATKIAISLKESGKTSGETFAVTLTDGSGTLSATGAGASGPGTSLTLFGNLAQVDAALKTLKDTATVPDTITVTAIDSFGNTSEKQITVTITGASVHPRGGIAASFLHSAGPVASRSLGLAKQIREASLANDLRPAPGTVGQGTAPSRWLEIAALHGAASFNDGGKPEPDHLSAILLPH